MSTFPTFIAPWRRSLRGPRSAARGEDLDDEATRRLRRLAGVPSQRWLLTKVRMALPDAGAGPWPARG